MFRKNMWPRWAILALLLIASAWFLNSSFADNDENYFKVDKGLFYLKQVYETISRNYVDEVDPEGLSKSAIKGIVDELDPYTVFFEEKGSERLEVITKGKYGGLGMEIGKREGKITVIAPIDNTPAQRAGVRAGDIITKIDDESTKDMSLDDASTKLRGKVGTDVTIELQRPGMNDPIKLTMTRQDIIIKDVSYAGFVEPGTAYFRLTSFSDKAGGELKDAVRDLQKQGKIERVILDLRGNPGGLLASAVEVANIFVPQGKTIVTTRGTHEREAVFTTPEKALLPDAPLVVLVDGGSASASEIVAGAIQDLDRGVIIGSPTFGKGLVQQVFPIDKMNDAFLKITTAKYYVPSGRCIQKEDYKKNKDVFTDLSDSTDYDNHKNYFTHNGRVVHGGGGIKPDVEVKNEKMDQLLINLWSNGYFFQFTVDYLAKHPEIKSLSDFAVTDEIQQEFKNYLTAKNMQFEIEGEDDLRNFLDISKEKDYNADLNDLVKVALQKLQTEKQEEFTRDKTDIKEALEAEFAEKLGGSSARVATMLKYDNAISQADQVFKNQEEYKKILAIKE
ncbi:MAG: S41 family peptidase [Calditrichia bacterium]